MAALTIRNLDEDTARALKQRAATHNRSLKTEVRQLLQDAAQSNRASLGDLARRIRAMTPDVPQTDSTSLLREDRERGLEETAPGQIACAQDLEIPLVTTDRCLVKLVEKSAYQGTARHLENL